MMPPEGVALALAFAVAIAPHHALAKLGNARNAAVLARTTATGSLRIEARTSELRVEEDPQGMVRIAVPLAGLDTGIALRNRHLREKYLQTDQYPNAELTVERGALAFPEPGQTTTRSLAGTMKLHGASRSVTFTYSARRDGAAYQVHGAVRININDYGVDTPQFLGVKVDPRVDVTIDFVVNDS